MAVNVLIGGVAGIQLNYNHCVSLGLNNDMLVENNLTVKGKVKVKVKQSRYRPGVAQRVPGI